MSTRSQKRKNNQQENTEDVSEIVSSPVLTGNVDSSRQHVLIAVPSRAKSSRVENSALESLRASLKEEITSEIMTWLLESQRETLKMLKPETNKKVREQEENASESEPREFYTPTRSVRISSVNGDTNISRNTRFQFETFFFEELQLSLLKSALVSNCFVFCKRWLTFYDPKSFKSFTKSAQKF